MSFQVIQERLNSLQETTKQVEELISRLANIKFQPGSIPQDTEDGDINTELSSEIHQTLKDQEEDLELLEQEVQDLPSGRPGSEQEQEKTIMGEKVAREAKQLKLARASFRKAQLTAKRNLEHSQRAERELLLSSFANPSSSTESLPFPRRKNATPSTELSPDEKVVGATSDVTAALRRTHALMQIELSRSQFAHDTLKESTAALAQLGEAYSTLDTMLSRSRNLLSTLLKSQKSDTWYLETAFYVLLATIAWLVFRRFVYGPAWWLVWLPLKAFYKAWMGVFAAVGLRGQIANEAGAVISERSSLIVHNSATRETISSTAIGSRAPSVNVGGGRKATPPGGTQSASGEDSMVEEVGKIIDDSQQEDSVQIKEHGTDQVTHEEQRGPPNPKKRMWEEGKEAVQEEQRKKNEL